jgi:hypothetical protein
VGGGVQLGPLGTAASNRPIVPAPGDYDDGEIGGMIGKGNWSTRRKSAPVPLCLPQTPHTAQTRIRATAVGSQRLTAWATARSKRYYFTATLMYLKVLRRISYLHTISRNWQDGGEVYIMKSIVICGYSSPNIFWMIESSWMKGEICSSQKEDKKCIYFSQRERRQLRWHKREVSW